MLRAMADETRLTLLLLLADRSRTVKELHQATGLSRTLISHHLAPLREQKLVGVFPQGRSNVYSLRCSALRGPSQLLAALAAVSPDDTRVHLERPDVGPVPATESSRSSKRAGPAPL
ncbi:helix-turn-helix transcriptional regulator [Streptomyces sp. CNQ085]|uniref:ArsR/SmtB family transcription factor n=1 Tax=Streptomyces sp. CNQ085 TaxID=2886944 RepID=UPI002676F15F|nr:metalloregulator ArsR/SmtB family transcription factor [Streptomyces sp. CNQ085]MCI0386142.1 metalloregulator ArsR/SmtB family transcription factor [Streptomyces sp. CNQ085]